jgi:hypothetical protein
MGAEQIDYAAVLADMEAKRGALDAAITSMRIFLAGKVGSGDAQSPVASSGQSFSTGEVPAGAFLGKSIPDAAVLYLDIVKRKATSKEIMEALKRGGMESTSNNFQGIVHACLDRYRKAGGEVVKLDRSTWGLAKWYPAGVRAVVQEKRSPTKKKAKAKVKAKANKRESSPAGPVEVPKSDKPGAQALIEAHFAAHPGEEFSTSELAQVLSIKVGAANLICAKLAYRHKLQKTESGNYRAGSPLAA